MATPALPTFNLTPPGTPAPATNTSTTPVITSGAAADHLATVIKPTVNSMNTNISNQSQTVQQNQANAKAAADAAAAAKATADAAAAKTAIDQQNANTKSAAVTTGSTSTTAPATPQPKSVANYTDVNGANPNNWYNVTNPDGTTAVATRTQNTDGTFSYTPVDEDTLSNETAKAQLAQTNDEYQAEADKVTAAITGITNGTIPLNPGEQAQVNGLAQSYQDLINQQLSANTNAAGVANIRGYQTGAAEYDPTFQVKTIGSIVTAGINKVADLNVKMAGALATLTDNIQKNDIANIKSAWDVYNTASENRQKALQATIADTQKQVDAVKTQIATAQKDAQIASVISQGVTDPATILSTLQGQGVTDITAADIASTVKALAPSTTGLSSTLKDFYTLKGQNQLPSDIASLPDDQQFMAFLKDEKENEAAVKALSSGSTISLATATKLGLPISTVGQNQQNIIDSLSSETIPDWFTEKVVAGGGSADPTTNQAAWDTFRNGILSGGSASSTSATSGSNVY